MDVGLELCCGVDYYCSLLVIVSATFFQTKRKFCENVLLNSLVSCGHHTSKICGFILSKRRWPSYVVSDLVLSLLHSLERLCVVKVYDCDLYDCDRDAVHM